MDGRRLVLAACALALGLAGAPRASAEPAQPALEKVRVHLQAALAVQMPKLEVTVSGNRLIAEYRVRPYEIYPASFREELPEQPVTRRGPDSGGLLLTLELSSVSGGNDATPSVPRDRYSPYWHTVTDFYPLRERREAVTLILLSGNRVPTKLLDQVRLLIESDLPPAPLEWEHPELRRVATRVRELLGEQYPEARLRATPNGLFVERHVRTFQVYGRSLTGELQPELSPTLGPEADGFLLSVTFQTGPYQGMAVVPQERSESYWTTHLSAAPLPGGNHLWVVLSYGTRTNREVVRKLQAAVAGEPG